MELNARNDGKMEKWALSLRVILEMVVEMMGKWKNRNLRVSLKMVVKWN